MTVQKYMLVFLIFFQCMCTEASVGGTVIDENGTAVSSVQVRARYMSGDIDTTKETLTNEAGEFEIDFNVQIIDIHQDSSPFVSIEGGRILCMESDASVRVSLFSPTGKMIYSENAGAKQQLDLSRIHSADGVYILLLEGDENYAKIKVRQSGGSWHLLSSSQNIRSRSTGAFQLHSSEINLSLYSQGYRTLHVLYQDDMEFFSLIESNQAPPDSDPLREGSMVLISAAGYDYERGLWDVIQRDESPVHTVEFTYDFFMDTALVTQKEYETTMQEVYGDDFVCPAWVGDFGRGDHNPAYKIKWGDAVLYCNARSILAGLDTVYTYDTIIGNLGYYADLEGVSSDITRNGYRLPTEAEWEYAARGGSADDYFWGNSGDEENLHEYTVWAGNSLYAEDPELYAAQPVVPGTRVNGYGLYDMAGNLSQWCHDLHAPYGKECQVDPLGPTSDKTVDYFRAPLLRGGNWGNEALLLRAGSRNFRAANYWGYFAGFRTVRTAER
ncbi:MAG: SUMF1/EgtB/PvdO family nonheme iron enzyme [Fibrobacterota bacterium]